MELEITPSHRQRVSEFQQKYHIGFLTIVFTDIVGSTKLKSLLGDQRAIQLIQQHHALLRNVLAEFHEAEEIDTAGDSFLIAFSKPSDAVKFSLLVQSELRRLAGETDLPVFDRIGIHVGEVWIQKGHGSGKQVDLYGIQVDTCARVQSLADADQILLTRSVFDGARQALNGADLAGLGPISWLNHGAYVMKGVDEPLDVCEVGEIGKARLAPPVNTEKAHRHISPDSEPVLGWRPAIDQNVPGTTWILERKLGEGGFGEVWLARDKVLKSLHVFKFCFRADRVRSLKREVTLFKLIKERIGSHPNIVNVERVYFDEPPFYVAMQYVEGADLRTWCENQGGAGKIDFNTIREIVAQIADALQAAHASGIIHRDVKPSNILVNGSPGSAIQCHLTDFGIGQVISEEALRGVTQLGFTQTLSDSGSRSGTYLYMAPELMAGKGASIQSDIYALGVVLFQLAVGDLGAPVSQDWSRRISDPLLREDLEKCFAGDPRERFASAGELAARLRSIEHRRANFAATQRALRAREGRIYRVSGTLLFPVVALACYFLPFADGIQRLSYDLPFIYHRSRPPADMVLVYLDEASLKALGQPTNAPMDRSLHTRLLNRLTQDGAKAVFYDIIFVVHSANPAVDHEFAAAIARNGHVILGSTIVVQSSPGITRNNETETLIPANDELLAGAAGSGLLTFRPVDPDNAIRRIWVGVPAAPAAIWMAATMLGARLPQGPAAWLDPRWVNYYGPADTFPSVSFSKALDPENVNPGYFKDKVVLIGGRPAGGAFNLNRDEFNSPYSRWDGQFFTGLEVHATELANLREGNWLQRMTTTAEIIILLICSLFIGALSNFVPPSRGIAGIAILAVVITCCAFLAQWYCRLWFNWLIPVLILVPLGVLWSAAMNYFLAGKVRARRL